MGTQLSEGMSEQCEQTSKRTSEWPTTLNVYSLIIQLTVQTTEATSFSCITRSPIFSSSFFFFSFFVFSFQVSIRFYPLQLELWNSCYVPLNFHFKNFQNRWQQRGRKNWAGGQQEKGFRGGTKGRLRGSVKRRKRRRVSPRTGRMNFGITEGEKTN